jgi:16S rRNA (cytidine1402-2'-O)-methyltransferase
MSATSGPFFGTLFLIPNFLSEQTEVFPLPAGYAEMTSEIKHFAVESDRSARKLLAKLWGISNLNHLDFFVLDAKKPDLEAEQELVALLKNGLDVGLISDAGYPSVADPGEGLVLRAHQAGIRVKPLVGPNSFIMALCASGLNAEQFVFHGYLPKEKMSRITRLKELERDLKKSGYAQIFMETPYRNRDLIRDMVQHLGPDTRLSAAWDITGKNERIITLRVIDWKKISLSEESDQLPAVFILGI